MQAGSQLLYLLPPLIVFSIIGSVVHIRLYSRLYQKLLERNLVDIGFKPKFAEKFGAGGCMGFITRIKRDVGVHKLTPEETALLRKASTAYIVGVPGVFIIVCLMFWILYRDTT